MKNTDSYNLYQMERDDFLSLFIDPTLLFIRAEGNLRLWALEYAKSGTRQPAAEG